MMAEIDNKELVRQHYNSHANPYVNAREQLRQRQEGPSYPLKQYHNDIKRRMIQRFTKPGCSLLDLCCGRGGDLKKWADAGVALAHLVDISEGEVEEARRRYSDLTRKSRGPLSMHCEFEVCDSLGDAEFSGMEAPYDMVTCMFAMHYFFEGETKLRMFLRNVSTNLKPGGYFFGTIPDGKRVLWHLQGKRVMDSPMLRLEKRWRGKEHEVQVFGHQYLWALHDTVTEGAGTSQGSLEYLTFTRPILRIAAHYDLVPVLDYQDPGLEGMFEEEDRHVAPFKHFFPNFPDSHESLMIASSTFMAFVFRKLRPGEQPPPIHPPLLKALPALDPGLAGADPVQGQGENTAYQPSSYAHELDYGDEEEAPRKRHLGVNGDAAAHPGLDYGDEDDQGDGDGDDGGHDEVGEEGEGAGEEEGHEQPHKRMRVAE